MKELRTLTPFGLELVTRESTFARYISYVHSKDNVTIYLKKTYVRDFEDAHQAALSDFLRLAVDKDLSKPIN